MTFVKDMDFKGFKTPIAQLFRALIDADANPVRTSKKNITWDRLLPFVVLHLGCLGVIWTGVSPTAFIVAVALYWVRMFLITAFFHRYFSHKTFEMNRFWQAIAAFGTLFAVQRGPLWWAAHHRHHHRHSDDQDDVHSPSQRGFFWAHMGWICCDANMPTRYELIPDLTKFPELVWINRLDWLGGVLLAGGLWLLGNYLYTLNGSTTGAQLLVWGFFISTALLFHATCTINSLSHVWGAQRFQTDDTSRNNPVLAIATMGEGWHNNHHFYPASARQGFYWWEVDMTYYGLKLLAIFGVVKKLHPVPPWVYQKAGVGLPSSFVPLSSSTMPSV
ncbi:MAG: acyl-CoA desaturase [Vampirovibrionales bacterium]|nr:acyl-CoA desaturase [Vampirovibrionales bacterium]